MAKRCLIVTYYFPPLGGAGVQRILKLVKYLSRIGWEFTVITADEKSEIQPLDHTLEAELPESLKIIRVQSHLPGSNKGKHSAFKKSSYWKRWLAAWFFIPDMRKNWILEAEKEVIKEVDGSDYKCVMFSIPPYSIAILAEKLQNKINIPVILDLRDPWSTHSYKIHPTPWHKVRNQKIEFSIMKKMKYGISAIQRLLKFYSNAIEDFDSSNWAFIPNGYDEENFTEIQQQPLDDTNFNIAFSGSIHAAVNNPRFLFRAISRINRESNEGKAKIVFHHIGKSVIDLNKLGRKYGISKNIKLWGYQSHQEVLNTLSAMDAFFLLHDDAKPGSEYIIGGKLYEYLRLKKPILALVPEDGEAADIIRECDAGVVLSAGNTEGIVQTLNEWRKETPQFSFRNIDQFSREKQARDFLAVFEKAISEYSKQFEAKAN